MATGLIRGVLLLLSIATATLNPETTSAASPQEDFQSEPLLVSALTNITGMGVPELERFIDFVTTCDAAAFEGQKDIALDCKRARAAYLVRYSRGQPLDRLINVVAVTTKYIQLLENTGKPEDKQTSTKLLLRYMEILRGFKDAANATYLSRTQLN